MFLFCFFFVIALSIAITLEMFCAILGCACKYTFIDKIHLCIVYYNAITFIVRAENGIKFSKYNFGESNKAENKIKMRNSVYSR